MAFYRQTKHLNFDLGNEVDVFAFLEWDLGGRLRHLSSPILCCG